MGSLIVLYWNSGDVCPGFQSQGEFPHLPASSPVCSRFLRFTSGATPANIFGCQHGSRAVSSTYATIKVNPFIKVALCVTQQIQVKRIWQHQNISSVLPKIIAAGLTNQRLLDQIPLTFAPGTSLKAFDGNIATLYIMANSISMSINSIILGN